MTLPQAIRATRLTRTPLTLAALALGLIPALALAQSADFQLRIAEGSNVFVVPNGSTLTLASSAVGQPSTATLTAIYVGTTGAQINSQPTLLGSTTFTVSSLPALPLTLLPGDSFTLTVQFTATSAAATSAQLNVPFLEAQATSTGVPGAVSGLIQLNLQGTSPSLGVSYALTSNGNVLPVTNGGSLVFPATLVNTTASATVVIANQGSATGTVNSISVAGSAFQPQGLPLPPFSIAAGTAVTFTIIYSPTQVQTDSGTLNINLGGNSFSATLTGSGINFQYSYQMITATGSVAFSPSQPVSLPDTLVGNTSSVTVKVQNAGTAPGTVATISTTNGPFTVTNLPLLPVTLKPNDILTFTLNFTPTQTGKNTGNLQVGNDLFSLAGNGLGPNLTFSYGSAPATVVPGGGMVIFSPLQVGQTASLPFTVTNSGTTVGHVASIAVADTQGIFTLTNLPPLPATMNPGDTFTFKISFAPATTGFSTSTLQIDTQTFTLSGSGTPPPSLPAVQFTGASGTVNPFSQPAIGLSLASPYTIDVSGTLTISMATAGLNPDPAVQFGTGGQKVGFTIPANSTSAVFASGGNQILVQTGTTAGTITVTAALATTAGLNLTPSPAPAVTLTVASSAPTILEAALASESTTGFTLQVVGFSTIHSLTSLNFQFTTTSGVSAANASVPVDVLAAATNWYASATSQPFGGQFSISIPFSLTQSSSSSTSPVSLIQSVTITASNSQGTSNSLSTPISGP
jgi:large repetitive protein